MKEMQIMRHGDAYNSGGKPKTERYGWSDTGEPGHFRMIHKNEIIIPEDSYQREASGGSRDRKVLRIASNFSWVAFQVISVMEREDGLYAVDGGHRLRAARKRHDVDLVPCMVYTSLSIADEAKHFDTVNSNRKPMGAVDRHAAHLVQGDPVAIKAERLVASSGRKISKNAGPGTFSCVNDLKKCIKQDEDALRSVWPVVAELCEGEKIPQTILGGLYYLERLATEPPSSSRFREKLMKLGYDRIVKAAKAGATFHEHRSPTSYADGILSAVNKGFHRKIDLQK